MGPMETPFWYSGICRGFNVDATYQVGFTDQYGTEPESWIDVPDTAEIDHDLGDGMYQIHFKGEKNDQSKDIYRLCNLSERTIITLSDYLFFLKEDGVKFYDGYIVMDGEKMDMSGNFSPVFGEDIRVDGAVPVPDFMRRIPFMPKA